MAMLMLIWEPKQWWNPTARQDRGAPLLTVNQISVRLHILLLLMASFVLVFCKSLDGIVVCFWLYWFILPVSVRFYEGGVRFSEPRACKDDFVKWEQLESYYWDRETLCLRVKKRLFQGDAQHRRIRIPTAQRKAVATLLGAHLS